RAAEQLLGVGTLSHINQLSIISSEIPFALRSIDPSESRTVSFYNETSKVRLSLSASMVRLNNRLLKVVAMKDISAELDNEQTQSWMQLSRVLTHEIMNSLAPITSLSEQLRTTTDLQTMHRGLEIISTTGKGLIEFVDNYRRLTRIPTPVMCEFSLLDLLKKVVGLISSRIEIEQVSDSMVVCADENLISQVLTNLLKNAIEATPNGERIWVKAYPSVGGQRTVIEVCNCGVPIDKEVRENIFVPFFTTKTGGSGIGLSLSRQIMRLHNGTLTLASGVVNGQSITCFILTI
ncbi:MAG: HAMP domain-containing sensor histidine kinase, partial [Mucinivorans sp.]